jgi:hypothetical protein
MKFGVSRTSSVAETQNLCCFVLLVFMMYSLCFQNVRNYLKFAGGRAISKRAPEFCGYFRDNGASTASTAQFHFLCSVPRTDPHHLLLPLYFYVYGIKKDRSSS